MIDRVQAGDIVVFRWFPDADVIWLALEDEHDGIVRCLVFPPSVAKRVQGIHIADCHTHPATSGDDLEIVVRRPT